jgi:hypothetical protein
MSPFSTLQKTALLAFALAVLAIPVKANELWVAPAKTPADKLIADFAVAQKKAYFGFGVPDNFTGFTPTNGGSVTTTTTAAVTATPTTTSAATPAPGFDIAKLERQVHFSYRSRTAGGFTGGDSTYSVEVDERGGFVFQPMEQKPATRAPQVVKAAPASFTTVTIGGALDPSKVWLLSDGGVSIKRDLAVESLHNSEDGVEQSWTFAERPAGGEDLVIHVAVSGQEYVNATATGLHFVDRRTGLGLRYGLGTWVDAGGTRTNVTPKFEAGQIVLRVPAALAQHSSFPAVLDPVISTEFGIDAPVIQPVDAFILDSPSMGFDGTNYLVTWADFRDNLHGGIWAAHVSPSGAILDPTGIALAHDAFASFGPARVACDGTNCLVVFISDTENFVQEIHGQLVSKVGAGNYPLNGNTADNPIVISETGIGGTFNPGVGFNGTQYLVAWSQRNTNSVRGALVTTAGTVVGGPATVTSGIPIAATGENPQIASDGTNFLVAYAHQLGGGIFATLVNNSGAVVAGPATVNAGTSSDVAVAWNGARYIMTWSDNRAAGNVDIWARAATAALSLDPQFQVTSNLSNQTSSAIACHGSTCLVSWIDWRNLPSGIQYDVFAHELSGSALSGPELALTTGLPANLDTPGVASDGTNFAVSYTNGSGSQGQMYILGVGGVAPFAAEALTKSGNNQEAPASAYDGTRWLVVWEDNKNAGANANNISGALINADGTVFTGPFPISTLDGQNVAPSVAFNGTNYLVAWNDVAKSMVVGASVDTAGSVSHPDTILAAPANQFAPSSPNVASDGKLGAPGNFLVTWQLGSSDVFPSSIRAQRFDGNLGAIGSVIGVYDSAQGVDGMAPKAAYDGAAGEAGNYLVTFVDVPSTIDLLAQRVKAADGSLQGSVITVSSTASVPEVEQQASSITFDGTDFVVAWRDSRNFPVTLTGEIYAAIVSSITGVVSHETAIATGGDKNLPTVMFDGVNNLFVWTDNHADDLTLARYDNALVPMGAPLSVSPGGSFAGVSLVTNGSGGTLIAYSQFELDAALGNSFRVRGRFFTNDPPTPVDSTPPTITPTVTGTLGLNGWYTSNVGLTWTVSEPESPASLVKTGCVDQSITTDQPATSYSCSASSLGGTAGPVTVTIKRDTTKPTLSFSGNAGSYTVAQIVSIGCTASDNLSGVAPGCSGVSAPAYTFPLGANTVRSSATDNAGNTGTSTTSFTVVVSSQSLATLTLRFVQGSAKYQALSPAAKRVVDATVSVASAFLTNIGPKTHPAAKAKFIEAYKDATQALARAGWLTQAQATTLATLADA